MHSGKQTHTHTHTNTSSKNYDRKPQIMKSASDQIIIPTPANGNSRLGQSGPVWSPSITAVTSVGCISIRGREQRAKPRGTGPNMAERQHHKNPGTQRGKEWNDLVTEHRISLTERFPAGLSTP